MLLLIYKLNNIIKIDVYQCFMLIFSLDYIFLAFFQYTYKVSFISIYLSLVAAHLTKTSRSHAYDETQNYQKDVCCYFNHNYVWFKLFQCKVCVWARNVLMLIEQSHFYYIYKKKEAFSDMKIKLLTRMNYYWLENVYQYIINTCVRKLFCC